MKNYLLSFAAGIALFALFLLAQIKSNSGQIAIAGLLIAGISWRAKGYRPALLHTLCAYLGFWACVPLFFEAFNLIKGTSVSITSMTYVSITLILVLAAPVLAWALIVQGVRGIMVRR